MTFVTKNGRKPAAAWPLRLSGTAFLVVLHLVFAFLLLIAMIDASGGHSSGDWAGIGVFAAAMVLGLPWSVLALFVWAPMILAFPVVNYALLWAFTIVRTRRQSPGATWTAAFIGIFIPTLLFAAFHFLLAWSHLGTIRRYPQHSFFDAGAFLVPAMAIANLWVLAQGFSSRAKLLAAGLALPLMAVVGELVWQATWYRVRDPVVDRAIYIAIAAFMLPTLWRRTWPAKEAVVVEGASPVSR